MQLAILDNEIAEGKYKQKKQWGPNWNVGIRNDAIQQRLENLPREEFATD
jgi:hypothetical protein